MRIRCPTTLRQVLAVACLIAAQLCVVAHAVGHEYGTEQDRAHEHCAVCSAAHQLDSGVATGATNLDIITPDVRGPNSLSTALRLALVIALHARGPPLSLPS